MVAFLFFLASLFYMIHNGRKETVLVEIVSLVPRSRCEFPGEVVAEDASAIWVRTGEGVLFVFFKERNMTGYPFCLLTAQGTAFSARITGKG